jgi:hypothetical protein
MQQVKRNKYVTNALMMKVEPEQRRLALVGVRVDGSFEFPAGPETSALEPRPRPRVVRHGFAQEGTIDSPLAVWLDAETCVIDGGQQTQK